MPFYTFQCTVCGGNFDVRATISEKEAGLIPECPQCRSNQTRQIITSGISFHSTGLMRNSCSPFSSPGCCG